jgi:hypothetical protein
VNSKAGEAARTELAKCAELTPSMKSTEANTNDTAMRATLKQVEYSYDQIDVLAAIFTLILMPQEDRKLAE